MIAALQINHAQSRHNHHHSPRIILSTHPCALVAVPQIYKVLPDTGPTKPHTRCISGGSRVERQVAGTNGEAPDFGRGLFLFSRLGQVPSTNPLPRLNQAPTPDQTLQNP
jgi:hypothetical protein